MKLFRKNKNKPPSHEIGNIYVVDAGTYGGDYLVLMEINNALTRYRFLALPTLTKRDIDFDVFERGVNYKVVNFIEKLPKKVFETCKQQYEAINTTI
jgi:hypothetical protein